MLKLASVWNVAIIPEKERQPMIDQLIMGLTGNAPLTQQDTREIVDKLIARKQTLFANTKRYIIDFQRDSMLNSPN